MAYVPRTEPLTDCLRRGDLFMATRGARIGDVQYENGVPILDVNLEAGGQPKAAGIPAWILALGGLGLAWWLIKKKD